MSENKAGQARQGLLDTLKGKAKEVAGAVTNSDDLVEEGQLQQAEARKRKEALSEEAVADAQRDAATQQLAETSSAAAAQERQAQAEADVSEQAIEQQRATEHAAAEQESARLAAEGHAAAETRAADLAETRLDEAEAIEADADRTEDRAETEQERLQREALLAENQAAQLRAAAADTTTES